MQVLHTTWPQGFITVGKCVRPVYKVTANAYAQNMRVWLEKPFLHEGHIGFKGSLVSVADFDGASLSPVVAGVEDEDEADLFDELVSKMKFTGIRFFLLWDHEKLAYFG